MRLLKALLVAVLAASAGCGSCGEATSSGIDAGPSAPAAEPQVPAPEGLLARAWIRGPDAFWAKIQNGASGAIALLPPTAGELVCAAGGLDGRLAPLVDGKGTSYAVVADGAGGAVAWAVALPLTDASVASSILLPMGDAQAAAPAREVAGLRLVPQTGQASPVVVALGSRWLVLAGTEEDLARLGPYAVGTLPREPVPTAPDAIVVDLPQSALAGPLSRRLGVAWDEGRAWLMARDQEQRAKHGGRAPDFGDPRVIVEAIDGAVKAREALLAAAQHGRLTIDADADDLHAELTVTPGTDATSAAALAALHPGDARPIGELPGNAIVAVLVRDDAASRAADTATFEATLVRALGERVHDDDTRALHAAMTDWAHARGDWWAASLGGGSTDSARGIWLRTPAPDADAAQKALRELVELSRRPLLKDVLAGSFHLAPAGVVASDVPSFGRASLATFSPLGAASRVPGASLGLGWATRDGQVLLVGGPSPPALLVAGASAGTRIGDAPRSARALASIGDSATFTLFSRPLMLDVARSGTDAGGAPATLAFGRKGGDVWARIELADVLLRELLHLKAGL